MNILYFAGPESVHTQRWINHFAETYSDPWDKVNLAVWSPPAKEDAEKIHPTVGIHQITNPKGLLRLVKIKPQVIHGHYISHYGILAAMYRKIAGKGKLILTAWGSDILKGRGGCRKWLTRWALTQADVVTCDANHMAKALTNTSTNIDKIKIVNFGTDTHTYAPTDVNTNAHTNVNTYAHIPIIISLRAHKPLYDVESLLEAAAATLKTHEARFTIAGDGPLRPTLVQRATELGISKQVEFTGNIPSKDIPHKLREADIYVNTSPSDAGLAASTAEAMACELPVVTTDFGDNTGWVQHAGILYPAHNTEQLAAAIKELIEHPYRRRRYGKIGRRIIQRRNNHRKEMDKMIKIHVTT